MKKPNRFFNWVLSGLYLFACKGRIGDIAVRIQCFFIRRYEVGEGEIPPWIPKWANDQGTAFQKGSEAMDAWARDHPILSRLGYGWKPKKK